MPLQPRNLSKVQDLALEATPMHLAQSQLCPASEVPTRVRGSTSSSVGTGSRLPTLLPRRIVRLLRRHLLAPALTSQNHQRRLAKTQVYFPGSRTERVPPHRSTSNRQLLSRTHRVSSPRNPLAFSVITTTYNRTATALWELVSR